MDDIQRTIGHLEGGHQALEHRMGTLEGAVREGNQQLLAAIKGIQDRLTDIETKAAELRGGWKVAAFVSTLVSGGMVWLAKHFL